ncbi:hypothetical protein, variant 1 [Verruconis gallopava]|nr:hypothetical protein, variant 1 [Verruconis gallopava]KIW08209.1 hypothetical protein, variant 1 [Verruconis gallopava]
MRTFYIPDMTLFNLPESIRHRIYEEVLSEGRNTVPLLQTCRQVLAEAQPIVFEVPVTFNSQYDLVEWFSTVGPTYARGVKKLHLTIQDLEVLPANRDSAHLSWPSLSLLELYQSEAEKVTELLSRFPNVIELSLLKPETVRSYLYSDYYLAILRKTTADLSHLKSIEFHSDEYPLQFAKSLPALRKLSFTGYSRSSPMETSSILSRLRHLEELELILPTTPTVFGGLEIETTLPKTLSLTREVIRDLRGLKSFVLRELKDSFNRLPVFCTSRFIQALDSTHRPTLQKLKIDLSFTPDVPSQRAIKALCSSSNLKHIDVVWPGMRGDLLNSLPKNLVSLRTAPTFGRPPYWVMQVVQWKRADLPNLRELCLVGDSRSSALTHSSTTTQAFRSAKTLLTSLGIKVYVESLQVSAGAARNRSTSGGNSLVRHSC